MPRHANRLAARMQKLSQAGPLAMSRKHPVKRGFARLIVMPEGTS